MKSLQVLLKSFKNDDVKIFCILAYFCQKMKNFDQKLASMPRKVLCSILLHNSDFAAFRQLKGVFKVFKK